MQPVETEFLWVLFWNVCSSEPRITMTKFVIEGGHPLAGNIRPVGNKNAALPMLAACLLSDEPITLHNLPLIGDVRTMLRILEEMGVEIGQRDASVTLCARKVNTSAPDARLFSQIRGSLTLMGPLLGRSNRFLVDTAAGASTPTCRYWAPWASPCATTASSNWWQMAGWWAATSCWTRRR